MNRSLVLLVLLAIVAAAYVIADPISPTALSNVQSGRRTLPSTSNGSIGAQGGNVTQVNINALTITNTWQGYFGNITGDIHLDDGQNKTFYQWGNATPSGEVYASRNSSIIWGSINCTNRTQRDAEEAYLGVVLADGDSVTNTFNSTSHPQFFVGTTNISQNSCQSTNGYVNQAPQTTDFFQILLSDNASNTVYTTIIDDNTVGYNGDLMDFQLMVGENEHDGFQGPTTYYFFVELN